MHHYRGTFPWWDAGELFVLKDPSLPRGKRAQPEDLQSLLTALELPKPAWSIQAFMLEANEGWMFEFLVGARRKISRAGEVLGEI